MAALQEGSPSALQEGEGSPSSPCGCCCTTPPRMVAPKKARSKMVKLVLDSVGELYQKSMEENRKRENPRGSEEEESSHLDVHALSGGGDESENEANKKIADAKLAKDFQAWNAKLSDFGLARLGPSDGLTHVSTAVVGTLGYASPEYIQTGRLTSKNDVWSYGVFLYELITGRRPLDRNRPRGEQKLLEWIRPYLSDGKKFQIILDPRLDKKLVFKSAQRLAIIANRCLVKNPKTRPKMSEVLEMVNGIVESSSSASLQLPLKSVKTLEVSQDSEVKNKKRAMDQKPVESSWFVRMWRPKLVRSC